MPDALEAAGAEVINADNFTSFVVIDRELITAQNLELPDQRARPEVIEASREARPWRPPWSPSTAEQHKGEVT